MSYHPQHYTSCTATVYRLIFHIALYYTLLTLNFHHKLYDLLTVG